MTPRQALAGFPASRADGNAATIQRIDFFLTGHGLISNIDTEIDTEINTELQSLATAAVELFQQGQLPAAKSACEAVLLRQPDNADILNLLGVISAQGSDITTALALFESARELAPHNASIHSNIGNVLLALQRPQDSLLEFDKAIALDPHDAHTFCNRAVALKRLLRYEEAIQHFQRAIELRPHYTVAICNLANTYGEVMQLEMAIACYQQIIQMDASFADAYLGLAMAQLGLGKYDEGWIHYESRGYGSLADNRLQVVAQPVWQGEPLCADQMLLLHAEQGLGDTLQFSRYVLNLSALPVRVVFVVPAPLHNLLQQAFPTTTFLAADAVLPQADYQVRLVSLPLLLGTNSVEKIPAPVPYLFSASLKRQAWRQRLEADSGEDLAAQRKLRIGLVWSGGPRSDQPEEAWSFNGRRNITLATLASLKHPAIDFISLQKGEAAEQELADLQAAHWDGPAIASYSEHLQDFSDTAALIDNLDLVIAVDTAVAHLAGAMGKPVWILNRFNACWRWLYGQNPSRTDSPWYPTARLFRQPKLGDWDSVIEQVRVALIEMAGK